MQYFKTEHMIVDYFTMTQKGNLFYMFKEIITRRRHISNVGQSIHAYNNEHVGSMIDE